MIKKLIYFIRGQSYALRMEQYRIELKEIERQQARIAKAYELQRIVMLDYGFQYLKYVADPETIIQDDQTIDLIHYFDPPFTFTLYE